MKKVILLGSSSSVENYHTELQKFKSVEILGYVDPEDPSNKDIFDSFLVLMGIVEKGDIILITKDVRNLDFELIRQIIRFGKHVFIDGFRSWSSSELEDIEKLRYESQTIFHFGNILGSLPITVAATHLISQPRFIKVEKHSVTPDQGFFDHWIFENLSEEMDLVQRLMKSTVRNISAKPMFLFGDKPDLVNIYMEFHNDAICHLSVGQAIEKGAHKMKVYQKETLIEMDFSLNTLNESKNNSSNDQLSLDLEFDLNPDTSLISQNLITSERHISPFNSRKMELQLFFDAIQKHSHTSSHLSNLIEVTDMVEVICEKVKRRYSTL
jgi:hypothetical protein